MKPKEDCPICDGKGYITVSLLITKNGTKIPTHIAPCPRCQNQYFKGEKEK